MTPFIGPILELLGKVFDRVLPDPVKQAEMKLAVLKMEQDGELETMKTQMSAIVAEAQSTDPWTSRARPSFMYVMYIMILMAIPMGVLYVFNPAAALGVAAGLKAWLSALPEQMWTLFGVGYLGYAGARTFEKVKGVANG